jgi:hypothetical protein
MFTHVAALVLAAASTGPERVLTAPSGRRLVEVERQQASGTWRYGPHPSAPAFARIVDPREGRLVARVSLGSSIAGAAITADGGRLAALDVGYRSQHAHEALPRALALFDLETGAETARIPLPYRTLRLDDPVPDPEMQLAPRHTLLFSDDGASALVFAEGERGHGGSRLPPELLVADLRAGTLRSRSDLPVGTQIGCACLGIVEAAAVLPVPTDGAFDLLAIGTATGARETIPLGAPRSFDLVTSGDVAFVFARPPARPFWKKPPPRSIRMLDRGRPGPPIAVPVEVEPARLSADGRRLALAGYGLFVIVDLETGRELRRENGRRRFERDLTLDEFLAGEPGFELAPSAPFVPQEWPWSASTEQQVCGWLRTVARGVK